MFCFYIVNKVYPELQKKKPNTCLIIIGNPLREDGTMIPQCRDQLEKIQKHMSVSVFCLNLEKGDISPKIRSVNVEKRSIENINQDDLKKISNSDYFYINGHSSLSPKNIQDLPWKGFDSPQTIIKCGDLCWYLNKILEKRNPKKKDIQIKLLGCKTGVSKKIPSKKCTGQVLKYESYDQELTLEEIKNKQDKNTHNISQAQYIQAYLTKNLNNKDLNKNFNVSVKAPKGILSINNKYILFKEDTTFPWIWKISPQNPGSFWLPCFFKKPRTFITVGEDWSVTDKWKKEVEKNNKKRQMEKYLEEKKKNEQNNNNQQEINLQ